MGYIAGASDEYEMVRSRHNIAPCIRARIVLSQVRDVVVN
jgi:hypothetical protein